MFSRQREEERTLGESGAAGPGRGRGNAGNRQMRFSGKNAGSETGIQDFWRKISGEKQEQGILG